MWEKVSARLAEYGFQGRVVPVGRLDDLGREIETLRQRRLVDPELDRLYLSKFDAASDRLAGARSIILVAVPAPQVRVGFNRNGEKSEFMIPPTYAEKDASGRVFDLLERVLEPAGYRIEPAFLPKKLLATHSGLARYGRNNISYVPGMGSFFGMVVAYSDMPVPKDYSWGEPQMLDRCRSCSACLRHCPANAIRPERFLLYAERCITFHNEKAGDVPLPAWMDSSWLNCLVGCVHCQRVCPENQPFWDWVADGPEFSEAETSLLLEGATMADVPAATTEKLTGLEIDGYLDAVSRNLKVLLGR